MIFFFSSPENCFFKPPFGTVWMWMLSAVQGYIWIKPHSPDIGQCHQSHVCQGFVLWPHKSLAPEWGKSLTYEQGPLMHLMESSYQFLDDWSCFFSQMKFVRVNVFIECKASISKSFKYSSRREFYLREPLL